MGDDGMSDLVKRLREYGDEPQDVSLGEIAEWTHKSADRIEHLERELAQWRENYGKLGLAMEAEKALADELHDAWRGDEGYIGNPVAAAYRKARGL